MDEEYQVFNCIKSEAESYNLEEAPDEFTISLENSMVDGLEELRSSLLFFKNFNHDITLNYTSVELDPSYINWSDEEQDEDLVFEIIVRPEGKFLLKIADDYSELFNVYIMENTHG